MPFAIWAITIDLPNAVGATIMDGAIFGSLKNSTPIVTGSI
jgi:hypothetical protein